MPSPNQPPFPANEESLDDRELSPLPGDDATGAPQSVKRKRRFWKVLGLVLLIVASAGYGYFNHTKPGREAASFLGKYGPLVWQARQNPNQLFETVHSDHFNILLVGRDVNYKNVKVYDPRTKTFRPFHVPDPDSPARSDTMIVMSLNKTNGTMRMISLPRDARVRLPPNKEGVRRAKLNAAHAYGGVDLLKKTLHDELGLTIHRHAVIKFEGFKKLIDRVGGIYVDVIGPVTRDGRRQDLIYDDDWGNLHIRLKPGKQWLNGQKAHDYVRYRMDTEGDTSRIRRQQSVMRALAKRLKEMPLTEMPGVIEEIHRQFQTDMNNAELVAAGLFAKKSSAGGQIQPVTLFGVFRTRGSLTLNRPKNEKLLHTVFGSTFDRGRFLVRSPSTDEDEIGPENNASPETQALLREAGIINGSS